MFPHGKFICIAGMAYLSTYTEEGNCVFIAYMLNSVKQQMICNEWSNRKVTRRDYNVFVLDQKPQTKWIQD